jgi:peptidoglycan/xylan/chitin deacetylase (PgdA/CDA1 family)
VNTPPAGTGTVREFVGYGQHMPKVTWPNGANVAINLVVNYEEGSEYSFDRDGENDVPVEAPYNFPANTRDLSRESMYEYGSRAGIWRLMRLFAELDVPCTFYACAEAFEKNPEVARYARAAGYDLLSHGNRWVEQWRFTREEEREQMKLAIKSFEGTWGERPRAWYCRYGASVNTRELVVEEGGFVYDSDAYNDDLPYYKKMGDHQQLVIPYSLTNNDLQGDKSPSLFSDYVTRAFDELWREGENGSPKMMSVGLHPRTVGQPSRANALREFIEHAQATGKVWFARRMDIANHWLEHHPAP